MTGIRTRRLSGRRNLLHRLALSRSTVTIPPVQQARNSGLTGGSEDARQCANEYSAIGCILGRLCRHQGPARLEAGVAHGERTSEARIERKITPLSSLKNFA